jgi:polar amino acid transport system substrate-binding protein
LLFISTLSRLVDGEGYGEYISTFADLFEFQRRASTKKLRQFARKSDRAIRWRTRAVLDYSTIEDNNQPLFRSYKLRGHLPMKITIAYIEEPPFGWTGQDGAPTGADVELAEVVVRAIGYTQIHIQRVTFEELLPGVIAGRWNLNVPIFVTPERSKAVDFSVPVWAAGDGFVVLAGNPKGLDSYDAIARRRDARLGVMPSTVQQVAALNVGVHDSQILSFARQDDAIEALLDGRIDAYAATALGNRAIADKIGHDRVTAAAHVVGDSAPLGAFSFSKKDSALRDAVNAELHRYLGTADHRQRMAKYGFSRDEIDPALNR